MPIKKALVFSVIINLFFLALCLIFGDLKFGAIDDYFMAARLTGAFGTRTWFLWTLFTVTRCCLFIIFSPLSGGITLARCFPYSSPLLSSVTYYCSGVANVGEASLRPFSQPCSPAIFTWLYNLHNALLFWAPPECCFLRTEWYRKKKQKIALLAKCQSAMTHKSNSP